MGDVARKPSVGPEGPLGGELSVQERSRGREFQDASGVVQVTPALPEVEKRE